MSIMTRVHGAVGENRLGYFQGENALVTIAIKTPAASADSAIALGETGVLQTLNEFKILFGHSVTDGIADSDTYHGDTNGDGSITSADDSVVNVGVEQRTIMGVQYDTDAEYVEAYATQQNLRRVVDSLQQRAVIIGVSPAVTETATASLDLQGYDKAMSVAVGDVITYITFLIERGTSLDKNAINMYGQLLNQDPIPGGELVDALATVLFLKPDATEEVAIPGRIAVKVAREIPSVL